MNILAHAYLSDHNDALLIGNILGDFIKGNPSHPKNGLLPGEIMGIRLHRAIDQFTDAHPDVVAVRALLHPRCHKYAGVAVDVFFDHFLARDFTPLSGEPLPDFVAYVYRTLQSKQSRLPPAAVRMTTHMVQHDWLTNYQYVEGIDRSLKGLSRRTRFPSGLDTAVIDLKLHYDRIGEHFAQFWPALEAQMAQVRTDLLLALRA